MICKTLQLAALYLRSCAQGEMAAQRRATTASALNNKSGPSQMPVQLKSSVRQNPISSTNPEENVAVLLPDDEHLKQDIIREDERRKLFQKVTNNLLHIPNGYRKVEVLILRWDESIDEFKGHAKEVSDDNTV